VPKVGNRVQKIKYVYRVLHFIKHTHTHTHTHTHIYIYIYIIFIYKLYNIFKAPSILDNGKFEGNHLSGSVTSVTGKEKLNLAQIHSKVYSWTHKT
jgi:hypothetical protein